ncbi:aquaporin-10 [Oryzias latipes]|uniref:Aquaporin 10b n=1 Tax=Oryzias latipes TaxID=8090 RepID=H2L3T3_ORYLA|nr:aquaporin-10 [Oryzias latipes]
MQASWGACTPVRGASAVSDSPLLGAAPPCDVSCRAKGQISPGPTCRVATRLGPEERSGMEAVLRKIRIQNQLVRECLAECLGVYVLILFGCGSAAQVTTSQERRGHYLSINLGFALGVTFGVFVSRGVSGAHLNPAVSLSLCVLGRHPWLKLPFYVAFQLFGAFLAAATVGLQYYDAIRTYGGDQLTVTGPRATAGIFSTYPADYLSLWGGVVDQVVGTAALLLCLLALGDQRNTPVPDAVQPVLVGLLVLVIGVSMGSNCGYALNPARDLGPRLFTYIAGWGADVFKAGGGWWWVPIVGPCAGALLGTLIYQLMVGVHHPPLPSECQTSCEEATETKMELEAESYLKSRC